MTPAAAGFSHSLRTLALRWLPWGSLALGLLGAVIMERSPQRAWMIGVAGFGGFLLMGAMVAVAQMPFKRLGRFSAKGQRAASFAAMVGMQSFMQLSFFFTLPFYLRAATWSFGHGLFLLLLVLASAITLWDPWFAAVVRRRWLGGLVQGFSSFVSLNCVLPMMGLSNTWSLRVAAFSTAALLPIMLRWLATQADGQARAIWVKATLALVAPAALLLGAGVWVPAAPMSLSELQVGLDIAERQVLEASHEFNLPVNRLVCYSVLQAPRGLGDTIVHEWLHHRQVVDVVPVTVRGGRDEGFRTWSSKRNFGANPMGAWQCRVRTQSGQLLGVTSFSVVEAAQH